MMQTDNGNVPATIISLVQILLLSAIFGFFYAYSVSVMWGLDLAVPAAAIDAMNGINTAVRNPAFAPAFFGPVFVGAIAIWAHWKSGNKEAAIWFLVSSLIYVLGCFLLTARINVPMNRELLAMELPADLSQMQEIWETYSAKWTFYNHVRMGFAGLSLLAALYGFYHAVVQNGPSNQRSFRPASPATLQSWNLPLL